jgi:methanol metabolism-related c-type cytochrome
VKRLGIGLFIAASLVCYNVGTFGAAYAEDAPPPAATEAPAQAAPGDSAAAQKDKKLVDGKWALPDGTPTYDVQREGDIVKKVDWYTYSGWRRYHAECHVCHGPNGEGSSFAPALADSLKTMDYQTFLATVSSGRIRNAGGTTFVMPALGDNRNVMCYIDDLYIYLRARSTGDLPGGRLSADQREEKPQQAKDYETSCLG